jgi:hypothetical protein
MTGEVSGKDFPQFRVVRLERLNEERSVKRSAEVSTNQQKSTEQAVSITFSANASAKASIDKVAQMAGNPIQREVSVAMEQAAKNKKEDVEQLAKKIADDVVGEPERALDAIGLTGSSAEVLRGSSRV